MGKWKVMLCSGNSELGEVEIKRGIFQGDSLSPLVFVLALILLSLEKGKIVKSVGIELANGKVIKSLQEGESYKYLGILEADKFLEEKMKLNVLKEYIRRLRKVLKSKLNGGNLVCGVSLLRYSAAFVSWRKWELQATDRETRKLFTIYGALHSKADVHRLYIPRKGGRGLISIEDCVELVIRGLEVYVHGSEERLIQAGRGDKIDVLEVASVLKSSKKEKSLEDWEEKFLHGQYLRQTKEVRSDQC